MNTLLASGAHSRVLAKRGAEALAALVLVLPLAAFAQDSPKSELGSIAVFPLAHITQQNDFNDLVTALRNSISLRLKVYSDFAQYTIVVRGTSEEIDEARKLIAEFDKPVPVYKLTFTITQFEDGKRIEVQHYALLAAMGQKVDFKEGHKVPVITGKPGSDTNSPEAEVQYLDVGLGISATFTGSALRVKVDQSAVADEKSNVGIQNPLIRQTLLSSDTIVTPGKPVILGSLDIANSTRHREMEVLVERVP